MTNNRIAPCRLNCENCDARIATFNNDDELRANTAEMYNYDPHTCYIYEINFSKEEYNGWLEVVIDGVGVYFVCDCANFSIRPIPKSKTGSIS